MCLVSKHAAHVQYYLRQLLKSMSICLSAHLPVFLSVCLSIHLPIHPTVCLSVCQSGVCFVDRMLPLNSQFLDTIPKHFSLAADMKN